MAEVKPFESVLIANRGEIAVRIARTCRILGIRSVAVYSDADAGAPHVKSCDEAVAIGGVLPKDSYLRDDLIIAAAKAAGAQAIHPGYGFLSENAKFASACLNAGITFVGPPPDAMQSVGDKIFAKQIAQRAGIPVIAGYAERDQSPEIMLEQARQIGTPILIKAAAGGGGRGMRLVLNLADFEEALESAQREARAAFGDETVFLERYVARPRHIEIQVLADNFGNVATFAERECSIQRRYQKIVEESPSPAVDDGLRASLQDAATALTKAVGYRNAGTVEFLIGEDGKYYFLEMNARLQVEHPVTEMVSKLDLVREQLFIAAGHPLALASQKSDPRISPRGHAIELRVYAEDVTSGFLPSTGRITTFEPPQGFGIRNDVAVETGSVVSAAYDPMIAKLIVHAHDRASCQGLLERALRDYIIGGVATNIGFLGWLIALPDFFGGRTTTDFLERNQWVVTADRGGAAMAAMAAAGALPATASARALSSADAWTALANWRHSSSPRMTIFSEPNARVESRWLYDRSAWSVRETNWNASVAPLGSGAFEFSTDGDVQRFAAWRTPGGVAVSFRGVVSSFELPQPPAASETGATRHGGLAATGSVQAPMSGTIVKVNVQPKDRVEAFTVLVIMEAMKMEHSIVAPYSAVVTQVKVSSGETVNAGDTLVLLSEG